MSNPLPGTRREWQKGCKIRAGEVVPTRDGKKTKPKSRLWFDVACQIKGSDRFATDRALMFELIAEVGVGDDPRNFKPRRIPIEFLSDDPSEWLHVSLGRWREGAEAVPRYRALLREHLAEDIAGGESAGYWVRPHPSFRPPGV